MAVRTISDAGGNYNATTAWVEGVVPTASDDVVATATSGNLTITATAACRSADFTNYVGTLALGSQNWNIGTSTVNGTLALKFVAGMTFTATTNTGTITFISTSATQVQVTTAGKTMPILTFNGAGGSWILQDAVTSLATSSIILTAGTLNTNGQTINTWLVSSAGSGVRTLTLGASQITVTRSGSAWNMSPATNLTLNANTSTVTMTGVSAAGLIFLAGALTFNNFVYAPSASGTSILDVGATFNNFTYTPFADKVSGVQFAGVPTVTGTLTINGSSLINRPLVSSSVLGTARTITAAAVSLSNVDFMDITGAGVASPFTGTSLGNALGNSGITFTAAVTRYAVVTGNWSASAMWASTSGGAAGSSVPLPQDSVVFDANSGASCTADMPRLGKDITFTGFTGTFSLTNVAHTQYGNLTFSSGMTLTSTQVHTFAGRGAQTITMAGKSFGSFASVTIAAPGGTYTLQDALTLNANSTLTLSSGTLDANGNNVSAGTVISTGTATRVLKLGSGTWTLTGIGGTIWQLASTGLTFTSSTSTVAITDTGANQKTFHGGGLVYNNLTLSGRGIVSIAEANTFNVVTVGAQQQVIWPASFTTTIASLVASGQNNGYLALPGTSGNYASAPNAAPLQITGNITVDCQVALAQWSGSGAAQVLVAKYATGSHSYSLSITSGGLISFIAATAAATDEQFLSSVATGFANGTTHWVRASLTLTNGTNAVCQFFTSSDGSTWTQLGSNATGAIIASIFNGTGVLEVGTSNTGTQSFATGNFYEARVYNSALGSGSGTPVFDASFATKAFGANTFTESSTNAATVTINGTVGQLGDGRLSMISSTAGTQATISQATGTVSADYLVLKDLKAQGGASFYAGANSTNVSNNTGWTFTAPPAGVLTSSGFFGA